MAGNKKQYGLLIPKKFNINEVKRATAFNEESDSDDPAESGTSDWIKKSFQKQAASQSSGVRRQTEIDMKRALDQDPSVYKYDEIYDDLETKKASEAKAKSDSKKPRYIQNLLKTAQKRKLENERRIERQVQKERDAEGEQFKDKETFVTSAYKKKLEEFHKLDEEEQKQDMLEEICDVSKQQDLGGFYRHLYRTTVDKKEKDNDSKEADNNVTKENNKVVMKDVKKSDNRQYRKRKASESSSLEEGEHNSDSDTSIESSSSSSASSASSKDNVEKSEELDKSKRNVKKEKKVGEIKIEDSPNSDEGKSSSKSNDKDKEKKISKENTPTTEERVKIEPKEPKINIWEKRTVGDAFEAALERYFKRKSERLAVRGC